MLNLLKKGGTAVLGTGIVSDDFRHPDFELKLFSVEGTDDITCDENFVYFDEKKVMLRTRSSNSTNEEELYYSDNNIIDVIVISSECEQDLKNIYQIPI